MDKQTIGALNNRLDDILTLQLPALSALAHGVETAIDRQEISGSDVYALIKTMHHSLQTDIREASDIASTLLLAS